jgi:transposase-like protein
MSRKRYTPEQIIGMLRQAEVELAQGRKVPEVCRSLGVSEQSYYRWRNEYGGLKIDQVKASSQGGIRPDAGQADSQGSS